MQLTGARILNLNGIHRCRVVHIVGNSLGPRMICLADALHPAVFVRYLAVLDVEQVIAQRDGVGSGCGVDDELFTVGAQRTDRGDHPP